MQMDWNWIPNHRSEIERESRGDCFLVSVDRERDVLSVGEREILLGRVVILLLPIGAFESAETIDRHERKVPKRTVFRYASSFWDSPFYLLKTGNINSAEMTMPFSRLHRGVME